MLDRPRFLPASACEETAEGSNTRLSSHFSVYLHIKIRQLDIRATAILRLFYSYTLHNVNNVGVGMAYRERI